ncbi:basement membrane-specific heparan sulfate proteoglycan core protein-like [Eriocheir sinensis]|uniref:basement membrane-specific heparan sulfate proteoglycan core protein-like n=1 Tax=Eriocheir sinensis TaxID=95602 RepID=UPI0021C8F2C9|nr:basement membrane-specific heparan sulfate proteoglycan core protein-like [Eriocheir sinensis]XP_050720025.1 basement membrane-specific heparan sulfate proteoglycan core protein-like [Eriocheir sinensis]XP_050720027.1 basement membrane-specific heparan sulfate proteoglycan core protein-like [Eriocheir sinensis]
MSTSTTIITTTTTTDTGSLSPSPKHSSISSSSSFLSDKRSSDSQSLDRKEEKEKTEEKEEESKEITPQDDRDPLPPVATHNPAPRCHSPPQPPSAVPAARGTPGDFNTADSRLPGPPASPCSCGTGREGRESRDGRALSSETMASKQKDDNTWLAGDDEAALIFQDDEREEGSQWCRRRRRRRRRRAEGNEGDVISEGVKKRPCGTPLCAAVILSLLSTASASVSNDIHAGIGNKDAPQFGETIQNVTVAAGREARLSCIVDNLGEYRVGWLKVDSQTILTLQNRVVTHNARVTLTHDQHRTWNLHIRQVKESDSGCYMCQINTPVMQNQVGCIKVHVPPDIINDETSSDTTVNEGDSVTLRCVAEGYPKPEIKWKREDNRRITLKTSTRDTAKEVESVPGNNLTLDRVSRKQMGAYLCIASNGVPPSVSKRIIVNVNFSPVVKSDNQLIGSPIGTDVEIECHVEAYPKAVNYWERENGEMLLDGRKYKLDENVDMYRVTMKLTIQDFGKVDAGQYKCISTNSLGKADTAIRLYEIEVPTPKSTTEHHQYNPYSTTPHSKSVNLIRTDNDYRKNIEGGGGGIPGGGGGTGGVGRSGEFINYGVGGDYKTREDGRNRQRSDRLEYDKTGGIEANYQPSNGEGMDGLGSDASALRPGLACRGSGVAGVMVWAVGVVTTRWWLLGSLF